jgi:hypothetical protein
MATVKFEYGKWDNFWGYQCSQCFAICPFVHGAIIHEEAIDANGGICPEAEKLENGNSS